MDISLLLSGITWNGAVAGQASLPGGSIYRARRLFWEVLVVERGLIDWTIDGRQQTVTAPTLVLLPATGFEERRYVDEQEHSYLGMRLSPDAAAALAVDPWRMVPLPPGTPATGLVRLAVSRARAGAGAAADAHLRSLVAMVLDGCTEQQPGPRWSPTVDRALDAIRHAWARAGLRDLPLSELATSAGVTTTSLCRAFARDIGTSPMAYQRLLRARIAVHRLRHSHQTVKRIAIETGFGDSRHLGRSLHHLFGHGSMEFRRNTRIVLPMPPGLDLVLWNEAMQE